MIYFIFHTKTALQIQEAGNDSKQNYTEQTHIQLT